MCKSNHKTVLGCVAAVALFVLLHLAPIGVVLPFLIHSDAEAEESLFPFAPFNKVFVDDGVTIYHTRMATRDCLIGIAEGRMANTVTIECLNR